MAAFGLQDFYPEQISFLPESIRNLVCSGRNVEALKDLDEYYVYTGRGPSIGDFHIGHLPGLKLALELQKMSKNRIYFMISDDEKIFRDSIKTENMKDNVRKTIEALQRLGFSEDNTIFRVNSDGITGEEYNILIQLMNLLSVNLLNNVFGEKKILGEYFYPALQIMPCFLYPTKRCVVVAGFDQDPFFRLTSDLARHLNLPKPIVLYTKNIPGLDSSDKMTTSNPSSVPIFLSDSFDVILQKVKRVKHVGAGSLDDLFEKGADLTIDLPYNFLCLLENNTDLVKKAYTVGLNESEKDKLLEKVPVKGIKTRGDITMITSFGMRLLLARSIFDYINRHQNFSQVV